MLNNQHLTTEQSTMLKEMYHSKAEIHPKERHLPYPTKVEIFEKKCIGCGFAVVHVTEKDMSALGMSETTYEFSTYEDLEDFLNTYGFAKNLIVERGCAFAAETIKNMATRPPYWDVNEIVSNTCMLWDINSIPPPPSRVDESFFQWYDKDGKVRMSIFGVPLPTEDTFLEERMEQLSPAYEPDTWKSTVKKLNADS
jgi:hypothetical protein